MAGSKSVVLAALVANGAIAVLKFFGFLLTGSAAMLSETYHSLSDTGNQVFLLIRIRYSDRARDRRHPFGYGSRSSSTASSCRCSSSVSPAGKA